MQHNKAYREGKKEKMTLVNPFLHLPTGEKNRWERGKGLGERTATPNNGYTQVGKIVSLNSIINLSLQAMPAGFLFVADNKNCDLNSYVEK